MVCHLLTDEGLNCSTFGLSQISVSRSDLSERYPDFLIDANVSEKLAGLSNAFVESLQTAFAKPVAVVA